MKIYVNKGMVFEYIKQPPLNQQLLLLTKDNKLVIGAWKGAPLGENKTYKAYVGFPDRDKVLEQQLGYL